MKRNILLLLSVSLAITGIYGQDDDIEIGFTPDSYIYLPYEYDDDPVHLAADDNENSVVTFTSISGSGTDGNTVIGYYDGFGKLKEEVRAGMSPARSDIVTFYEYDVLGRKKREWLPAAVAGPSTGMYVMYSQYKSAATVAWNDNMPYTDYGYEPVPDGQMTGMTGPGSLWHGADRSVRNKYLTNISGNDTLNCVLYTVTGANGSTPSLSASNSYASGSLMVTRTENEDGLTSMEFKDRHGRTVLSRMIEHKGTAKVLYDTYYIYDGNGNLVMIVPPALSSAYRYGAVPAGYVYEYAYIYAYDGRNRRYSSKMPGADAVLTEYDGADRPMFVQTAEQRKRSESTFHIYDVFGRECLTGTCSYNIPASVASVYTTSLPYCKYTGTGDRMGYEIYGLAPANVKVLTANYYDSYGFTDGHEELAYTGEAGYGRKFNKAQGLLTGRATACLSGMTADTGYLYEAVYYDYRQRVIQKRSSNCLKGTDSHFYAYDFSGNEISHRHVHTSHIQPRLSTVIIETACTYDHAGRLKTMTHSVNGSSPVTVIDRDYDEQGRLKRERRNGHDGLLTEYGYNVRSWITGISGQALDMSMGYETGGNGAAPRFSGNMSSMQWKTADGKTRAYSFAYDGLSRITGAGYKDMSSGLTGLYDTEYSYDSNGNIQSLMRKGKTGEGTYGVIDDLFYEYDGNRVRKVTDAVDGPFYKGAMHFTDDADDDTEYGYDADGNLIEDRNKGITRITYNVMNLPEHMEFDTGKYINFTYSSTGEKLRSDYLLELPLLHVPGIRLMSSDISGSANTRGDLGGLIPPVSKDSLISKYDSIYWDEEMYAMMYGAHRIDYCGDIIYENLKPTPNRILFNGGYVTFSNKQPVYHFYLTDHQGNVRVVADGNGAVEQINHYYPFGSLFGEVRGDDEQRYRYNGKELERLLALDWYDYGARWYDPVLGIWHSIDPLAGKYPSVSPYVYCLNNPMRYIDLKGLAPGDFFLTVDAAAIDFGMYYNCQSIKDNIEYASYIFKIVNENGESGYSYGIADKGNFESVTLIEEFAPVENVATIHTHGAYSEDYGIGNDTFSGIYNNAKIVSSNSERMKINTNTDIGNANYRMLPSYLVTPSGTLMCYNPNKGNITIISNEMPSDFRDPNRINIVDGSMIKENIVDVLIMKENIKSGIMRNKLK